MHETEFVVHFCNTQLTNPYYTILHYRLFEAEKYFVHVYHVKQRIYLYKYGWMEKRRKISHGPNRFQPIIDNIP